MLLRLQYPTGIFQKNPWLMSKQLCEILLCFLSTSSFWLSPPCQADASGRITSTFSCWLWGLFFFCASDTLLVQLLVIVWLSSLTGRWRAAKWCRCEFCLVPLCSAWVMFLTVLPTLLEWKMPGSSELHVAKGWTSSIIWFLIIFITKCINEDWNGPIELCVRDGFVCALGLKEHYQAF